MNTHATGWFWRTTDPLMCINCTHNDIIQHKCFRGLPLKFNSAHFGGIRSKRKWNFQTPVYRKWEPETACVETWCVVLGFMSGKITSTSQIDAIRWCFRIINSLVSGEPARILVGQPFRSVSVKVYAHFTEFLDIRKIGENMKKFIDTI